MPKNCPADKILNPATGRCVSRTGKIGQKLLASSSTKPATKKATPKPVAKQATPKPVPATYYVVVLKSHGLKHWHEIASGPYQTYGDADASADENNEIMFGGPLGNCYLAVRMGDRKDGRPWKRGDHIVLNKKVAPPSGCVQFTASNTSASKWKRYSARASPPFPANECPEGMIQKGNDGNDYAVSAPNAKGVKRWVKVKTQVPTLVKPKAKLKAKSVPIPPLTKPVVSPQQMQASPKKPVTAKKVAKPSGCVQYTASNTSASQWKKYSTRASPPFPANECPEGMIRKGNDGNDYAVSAPNAKGVKRWVKVKTQAHAQPGPKTPPAPAKPKAKPKAKPSAVPVPVPAVPAVGLNEKFLYKQDSKGKVRQWRGWVEQGQGNSYLMYVETGLLDGNKTTTRPKVYSQGKQGRDAKGQALSELESKISKKRDEGYFDTIKQAQGTLVALPMLALDFKKRSHDVSYPAIGQRKFDGVRCMASLNPDGTVSLKSRKGKEFPHMTHLRQQIAGRLHRARMQLSATLKGIPDGTFLDGEMYSDTLTFQEVVGLVRRETLKPGDEDKLKQISYRLYDMFNPNDPMAGFQQRYDNLKKILGLKPPPNLILTENVELNNKTDIKKYHDQFVKEGYEGIMVRNKDGEYGINKRSKHLQKFKEFFDHEFEIVGFEEGTGNDAGTVIWVCKTDTGGLFKARPIGTRAERTEYFNNGSDYIGSLLTVRYFELTNEGIPRFPVGVTIRNYE